MLFGIIIIKLKPVESYKVKEHLIISFGVPLGVINNYERKLPPMYFGFFYHRISMRELQKKLTVFLYFNAKLFFAGSYMSFLDTLLT